MEKTEEAENNWNNAIIKKIIPERDRVCIISNNSWALQNVSFVDTTKMPTNCQKQELHGALWLIRLGFILQANRHRHIMSVTSAWGEAS